VGENWQEQVKQLLEGIHGHQKKSLALMVLGIVLSGSAVLQRMARSVAAVWHQRGKNAP